MGDLVGVVVQPGGAGLFESSLEHVPVAAFDHARANGQAQGQGSRVVQSIESMAQVAMALAHRRFFVRSGLRFQMFGQGGDNLRHRPTLESPLLGVPPRIGLVGPAHGRGGGQVFTDMKKSHRK